MNKCSSTYWPIDCSSIVMLSPSAGLDQWQCLTLLILMDKHLHDYCSSISSLWINNNIDTAQIRKIQTHSNHKLHQVSTVGESHQYQTVFSKLQPHLICSESTFVFSLRLPGRQSSRLNSPNKWLSLNRIGDWEDAAVSNSFSCSGVN